MLSLVGGIASAPYYLPGVNAKRKSHWIVSWAEKNCLSRRECNWDRHKSPSRTIVFPRVYLQYILVFAAAAYVSLIKPLQPPSHSTFFLQPNRLHWSLFTNGTTSSPLTIAFDWWLWQTAATFFSSSLNLSTKSLLFNKHKHY